MTVTIYHNPRCSKSRESLALLQGRGIEPEVILYLEQARSLEEIRTLLEMLGMTDARDLMRKGEEEYKSLGLNDTALTQEALIAAMATHPRLIERPIVVNGQRAAIGRPPERVLGIL